MNQREKPLILIIDDDESFRYITALHTKILGYESISAQDGQEALEILVASKPDLVLCDGKMPRMDGRRFVTEIFENDTYQEYRKTPIVIHSSEKPEAFSDLEKMGRIATFLPKSKSTSQLPNILQQYVPLPTINPESTA